MTNKLKTGLDYLAEQLKIHASQSIVYKRGTDQVALYAVIGKTTIQTLDQSGFVIGAESVDFLFLAEDLVLSGQMVTPQHGDRIEADRAVYQVHHLPNEGCWKYSDPFGKQLRVHVKQVETI